MNTGKIEFEYRKFLKHIEVDTICSNNGQISIISTDRYKTLKQL